MGRGASWLRRVTAGAGGLLAALMLIGAIPTLLRRDRERYVPVLAFGHEGTGPGEFRGPIGVAVDDSGYAYITDSGNDRIEKFAPDGKFIAAWGGLRRPMHIRLGAGSLLYVAEYLSDRVRILSRDGITLGQIGDTFGGPGSLDAPGGVAVSPDARQVWIADFYHHRVAVFSRDGRYGRQVGRPGRLFGGRLHYPTDVAFARGDTAYVADAYNNRIQRFAPDGRELDAWGGPLGSGIPGPWRGWFRVATGVAVDAAGDVYVADFYNDRIQKFRPGGRFVTEWGTEGTRPGQFDRPSAVAFGPGGRVYVVDFGNNRVQVFTRFP